MLFARCGERASRPERDCGSEQPKDDISTCSRWRSLLLLAGMRVRAPTESCNKPSIQKPSIQPQDANDLGPPHDDELDGKSNILDRADNHPNRLVRCGNTAVARATMRWRGIRQRGPSVKRPLKIDFQRLPVT